MKYTLGILAGVLVFMSGCISTSWRLGEDDLTVSDNQLLRGDKSFTVRAIHVPNLCEKGSGLEFMVPAMARIAEVGGNAIAMDLCGYNADCSQIDVEALNTIVSYAERAKDQRMVLVVRLVGDIADSRLRQKAIQTAARALAHQALPLYWIDGSDAPALAKAFKQLAPHVVVAAPANGDIITTGNLASANNPGVMMVIGNLPEDPWGETHYILPGTPESYLQMEEAYTNEIEKKSWTPDNLLLSEEERNEGFICLFNGRDLDNWWPFFKGKDSFRINEEGAIECYQGGAGGLMTRDRYENFILRLEYKFKEPGANSGIHIWAPRSARQSKIGFEFQLMGDSDLREPHATSTGAIYDVVPALTVATRPEGEWNEVEIQTKGSRVRALLNGILVQDINFDEVPELRYRLRRGFIGLQDHDSYVAFRNIRIKVL